MSSDPNAPDILDEHAPPKTGEAKPRERYNTRFVVDAFAREERRNRLIVAGLAAILVLSLGVGLLVHASKHPAPKPGEPTEASAPPAEAGH